MSESPDRVPQELVDAFFDRALDEGSREKFFGMLRADLSRCAEVAKTQRMIAKLREPIEAPDLADRIMARVDAKRGFLPERVRRMVTRGRMAAAACVLLGILGIAMVRRVAPDALRLVPAERPLSGVIESGRADAVSGVQQMAAAVSARPAMAPLSPGRIAVRTLVRPEGSISLPSGAGGLEEARFVFVAGRCVDRRTEATVVLGSQAACPEALEQFITNMAQSLVGAKAGGAARVVRE